MCNTLHVPHKIICGPLVALALFVSSDLEMVSGLVVVTVLVLLFEGILLASRYF